MTSWAGWQLAARVPILVFMETFVYTIQFLRSFYSSRELTELFTFPRHNSS